MFMMNTERGTVCEVARRGHTGKCIGMAGFTGDIYKIRPLGRFFEVYREGWKRGELVEEQRLVDLYPTESEAETNARVRQNAAMKE